MSKPPQAPFGRSAGGKKMAKKPSPFGKPPAKGGKSTDKNEKMTFFKKGGKC